MAPPPGQQPTGACPGEGPEPGDGEIEIKAERGSRQRAEERERWGRIVEKKGTGRLNSFAALSMRPYTNFHVNLPRDREDGCFAESDVMHT